jgi:hypothetical protein
MHPILEESRSFPNHRPEAHLRTHKAAWPTYESHFLRNTQTLWMEARTCWLGVVTQHQGGAHQFQGIPGLAAGTESEWLGRHGWISLHWRFWPLSHTFTHTLTCIKDQQPASMGRVWEQRWCSIHCGAGRHRAVVLGNLKGEVGKGVACSMVYCAPGEALVQDCLATFYRLLHSFIRLGLHWYNDPIFTWIIYLKHYSPAIFFFLMCTSSGLPPTGSLALRSSTAPHNMVKPTSDLTYLL